MHWNTIPVTVTRNPRARRVWLKMRSCRGIEVVLPYRVSASEVPSILERNGPWLLERLHDLRERGEAPGQSPLPEAVRLEFTGREYSVSCAQGDKPRLRAGDGLLRLALPPGSVGAGALLLQKWLLGQGKEHLVPFCLEQAECHGVRISGVRVRNQNGRWGSCSPRGGISLNAKLLLLPPDLVRNVVLHELCHIRHRNHGPDFWTELRRLDPDTDTNEIQLRRAWERLPVWTKWRRNDPA